MKLSELIMEEQKLLSGMSSCFGKGILRYFGGKSQIADWIVSLIPPHECYVEPFFGSGKVFFRKRKSKAEIINDIDERIYALFKVLSDEELFSKFLEKIWFLGAHEKIYEEFLQELENESDLVGKAVKFFYVVNLSFSGGLGWSFIGDLRGSKGKVCESMKKRLLWIHKRLKGVWVYCRDWKDVVEKHDGENVLMYLDPPYIGEERTTEDVYSYEMSEEDHEELVDVLLKLKAKVILSGYKNKIYERLEKNGWLRLDRKVRLRCSAGQSGETERTESLWLNFEPFRLFQRSVR